MANTKSPGKVLQTWLSPELADQVQALAERERRPVSQLIRVTLEDRLRDQDSRRSGQWMSPS